MPQHGGHQQGLQGLAATTHARVNIGCAPGVCHHSCRVVDDGRVACIRARACACAWGVVVLHTHQQASQHGVQARATNARVHNACGWAVFSAGVEAPGGINDGGLDWRRVHGQRLLACGDTRCPLARASSAENVLPLVELYGWWLAWQTACGCCIGGDVRPPKWRAAAVVRSCVRAAAAV
jgi:hypothetical protein